MLSWFQILIWMLLATTPLAATKLNQKNRYKQMLRHCIGNVSILHNFLNSNATSTSLCEDEHGRKNAPDIHTKQPFSESKQPLLKGEPLHHWPTWAELENECTHFNCMMLQYKTAYGYNVRFKNLIWYVLVRNVHCEVAKTLPVQQVAQCHSSLWHIKRITPIQK